MNQYIVSLATKFIASCNAFGLDALEAIKEVEACVIEMLTPLKKSKAKQEDLKKEEIKQEETE